MSNGKNIRRRRANYLLPSESGAIFNRMIGKSISKIKFGIPGGSGRGGQDAAGKSWNSLSDCYGGPFFITYEGGITVIFYDDDFLGSIVVRELTLDVDEVDFFEVLESDDRLGERMKIRKSVDLMPTLQVEKKLIESISVWKLPDNFHGKPIGYDMVCECVVSMNIAGIGEIIFASYINESGKAMDIRISRWEWLEKSELDELICILRTTQ